MYLLSLTVWKSLDEVKWISFNFDNNNNNNNNNHIGIDRHMLVSNTVHLFEAISKRFVVAF